VASYFTTCYRYALSRGWKRLAFLVTTDAGGQLDEDLAQKELLKPEFSSSGLTIVANERYNIADISVAAQLSRIKAANPQTLARAGCRRAVRYAPARVHDAGMDVPFRNTERDAHPVP